MKTLQKLRSSAPMLIGALLALTGIAMSALAHPHDGRKRKRERASGDPAFVRDQPRWPQPAPPRFGAPPFGSGDRRLHGPQQDMYVRHFLFAPCPMPRRPMMKESTPQASFRSPFVFALDRDEDGFIGPEEIAQAAEALKAMDLNDDGRIGPAEWKARREPLPIESDSGREADSKATNRDGRLSGEVVPIALPK